MTDKRILNTNGFGSHREQKDSAHKRFRFPSRTKGSHTKGFGSHREQTGFSIQMISVPIANKRIPHTKDFGSHREQKVSLHRK